VPEKQDGCDHANAPDRNRDYQPPQLTPRAFARLHSHWADGDAERHHDVHQPALAPHALNVGHDTHIMMQMQ